MCNKNCYATKEEAERTVFAISPFIDYPLFVYECKCCKAFHLTKQENMLEAAFIADGKLKQKILKAMSRAKTFNVIKLSTSKSQHWYQGNDGKKYKFLYDKTTKTVTVIAVIATGGENVQQEN